MFLPPPQAGMNRAFSAWSDNHKYINFRDVTQECDKHCEETGECYEDCPFSEVFVTILNTSSTEESDGPSVPVSVEAANAMPKARLCRQLLRRKERYASYLY